MSAPAPVIGRGLEAPPRGLRVLFLASRFPHPPLRGDQVRAYHQLRLLGLHHRLTLLCFSDGQPSPRDLAAVSGLCEDVITLPAGRLDHLKGFVRALTRGLPLQTGLYHSVAMRQTLRRLLDRPRFDLVHVQLARMAPLLPSRVPLPVVVDLVDALSLNMARRRGFDRSPMGWAAGIERSRLLRYERRLCHTRDQLTVVSEDDRSAIGDFPNLTVNPNGVDLEHFSSGTMERDGLVFTGNLGYFPNADAAMWFGRSVLPLVRRELPEARWVAAGTRPSPELVRLGRQDPRTTVTGTVPSLRPYIARAAVAVAPLRSGSGQLLKVLEAMACGTPVVATPRALAGTTLEPDHHLLVGASAEEFAQQVLRLLREPDLGARLAAEAHRYVERHHSWEHSVGRLQALYFSLLDKRGQPAQARDVAAPRRSSTSA